MGAAKIDLDVEFLFKEVGAALRVAQVFGGIAAGVDLQCDATALERRANIFNTLAMRVVQPFRDAQNGGQAPRDDRATPLGYSGGRPASLIPAARPSCSASSTAASFRS